MHAHLALIQIVMIVEKTLINAQVAKKSMTLKMANALNVQITVKSAQSIIQLFVIVAMKVMH